MTAATIPVIELSGPARERGRQYGEAARAAIGRSIEFYRLAFAGSAGLEWDEVCSRARAWIPLIEDYLPGILDEVAGIADGSGRTFEEILALNGRGELSYANPFLDESTDGCSSFAMLPEASADGHVYCGQNWDWRAALQDTVVMLRIEQPGRPTILMQTEAGQIGRQGANSAGLGLNANGLGGRFGEGIGVPGTYVRRKVLESWDMHDALEAVFNVKQAFSTNILLSHRDGFAIDVETTPGRHGWMYADDGVLVHGNHFIAFVPPQVQDTYKPFAVDSLYRVPRIRDVLMRCRSAEDSAAVRELIAGALRDHFGAPNSVCNHRDPARDGLHAYETLASSIVDLTTGEYRVTAGLPCQNDYALLPYNLYDGPTERPASTSPTPSTQMVSA